jgi:hypothetical protein
MPKPTFIRLTSQDALKLITYLSNKLNGERDSIEHAFGSIGCFHTTDSGGKEIIISVEPIQYDKITGFDQLLDILDNPHNIHQKSLLQLFDELCENVKDSPGMNRMLMLYGIIRHSIEYLICPYTRKEDDE